MAKSPHAARGPAAAGPGRIRIVAGKWRRRLLPVVDVEDLRPTSERIRETLFNWLAPRIEGARCLDLCAGSGALGFEALSRGAREALLIDSSPGAVRAMQRAKAELGAGDAVIVAADVRRWLADERAAPFDIVFVDPPYRSGLLPEICRLLAERGWLAPDARIYLEWPRAAEPPALPEAWQPLRDKTAGAVRYMLLAAPETT